MVKQNCRALTPETELCILCPHVVMLELQGPVACFFLFSLRCSGNMLVVTKLQWPLLWYFQHTAFAHATSRYDRTFTLSSQCKRGSLDNEMWLNHPSVCFVCGQVPRNVISQLVMTCDSAAATVVAREWVTQSSKAKINDTAALFPRLELRTLIIKLNNKWRWPKGRGGWVAEKTEQQAAGGQRGHLWHKKTTTQC